VILLDTTVLCYAVGTEHPLRDPCRVLIGRAGRGELRASTTVEVVQEFVHVRARRRGRADAVQLARAYVRLLAPLQSPDEDTLEAALRLYPTIPALGSFDVLLAATAVRSADTLLSADRAFADVPGLHHVVPDAEGIATLR